jgi:hypothetical protein
MNMHNAPSDRDYSEYLNPSDPEDEEPEDNRPVMTCGSWVYQACYSIDWLNLPKVEKVSLKPDTSEEVPF